MCSCSVCLALAEILSRRLAHNPIDELRSIVTHRIRHLARQIGGWRWLFLDKSPSPPPANSVHRPSSYSPHDNHDNRRAKHGLFCVSPGALSAGLSADGPAAASRGFSTTSPCASVRHELLGSGLRRAAPHAARGLCRAALRVAQGLEAVFVINSKLQTSSQARKQDYEAKNLFH